MHVDDDADGGNEGYDGCQHDCGGYQHYVCRSYIGIMYDGVTCMQNVCKLCLGCAGVHVGIKLAF